MAVQGTVNVGGQGQSPDINKIWQSVIKQMQQLAGLTADPALQKQLLSTIKGLIDLQTQHQSPETAGLTGTPISNAFSNIGRPASNPEVIQPPVNTFVAPTVEWNPNVGNIGRPMANPEWNPNFGTPINTAFKGFKGFKKPKPLSSG